MDNYGTHKVPKVIALVRAPSALSPAFHADERELAQSSGALLREDHDATDSTRHLRERASAGNGDSSSISAHHNEQCTPVCLDRDRRCHLRQGQTILRTNFGDTTLEPWSSPCKDLNRQVGESPGNRPIVLSNSAQFARGEDERTCPRNGACGGPDDSRAGRVGRSRVTSTSCGRKGRSSWERSPAACATRES